MEAFVWLTLAAKHGAGHALASLEPIVEQMSIEEKRAAQAQLAAREGALARAGLPSSTDGGM